LWERKRPAKDESIVSRGGQLVCPKKDRGPFPSSNMAKIRPREYLSREGRDGISETSLPAIGKETQKKKVQEERKTAVCPWRPAETIPEQVISLKQH